jgi:hypothetical protein
MKRWVVTSAGRSLTNRCALVLSAAALGLVALFVTVLLNQPALGIVLPSRLIFRARWGWTHDTVLLVEYRVYSKPRLLLQRCSCRDWGETYRRDTLQTEGDGARIDK